MANCMNCGVAGDKQWAGVRVCDDCKRLADKLMQRNQKQVETMLLLCKEKIRATLIEGKLRVRDAEYSISELRSDLQAPMRALQEGPVDSVDQGPRLGANHKTSRRGG